LSYPWYDKTSLIQAVSYNTPAITTYFARDKVKIEIIGLCVGERLRNLFKVEAFQIDFE
jgi:hypothetical protein